MNCPLCLDSILDVTFHAGIELDICPTCRGVWLDRGELDRIAADTAPNSSRARPDVGRARSSGNDRTVRDDFDDDTHDRRNPDPRRGNKRKKSLASRLGDAFEEIIDL